jgi:FAD/FMN-containing dehydrogenase
MLEQATCADVNFIVHGTAVEEFQASLHGQLLKPGEEGYDQARAVWNGMIDKRPALIARCADTADVIQCVNFARTHGLTVSVRGGGHSAAGKAVCDGGLMIDLSSMKNIRVDPVRRTARAEPGVRLGELDHETQAFGLATPLGVVSETGIAGLTLGGGQGWLMGKHGLTIDNLLSVDMVLADGRFLTASESENADLFWAVRGGGGNFGIVTSFEYRLHRIGPTIMGGFVLYPIDQAKEMLEFYREYSQNTPDELMSIAAFITTPEGLPAAALAVAWFGPLAEAEEHLRPLRTFGSPLADLVAEMPYTQLQTLFDAAFPTGIPRYLKTGYLPRLDDEILDRILAYSTEMASPLSLVGLFYMKGAVTRVAPEDTPFPHRNPQWYWDLVAQWTDPAEADTHLAWARAFWQEMEPYMQGAGINFLGTDDGDARVRVAYGQNYAQLVEIKKKYDPANFFSINFNIDPRR